jgi:hypothetical protein
VDNNPIRFDHKENSEEVSPDQQPAISTSIKAPAQGESRKLFEPGLYALREGLFFPVSMFSNLIVGLLQILLRNQGGRRLSVTSPKRYSKVSRKS